jgi:cytochrome c oxidase subunit 1/cytochrome c oxidase subunit I+III
VSWRDPRPGRQARFRRRPLVGYTVVALSTMATMAIGFGVWTHHMFADLSLSFFSGGSIIFLKMSATLFLSCLCRYARS